MSDISEKLMSAYRFGSRLLKVMVPEDSSRSKIAGNFTGVFDIAKKISENVTQKIIDVFSSDNPYIGGTKFAQRMHDLGYAGLVVSTLGMIAATIFAAIQSLGGVALLQPIGAFLGSAAAALSIPTFGASAAVIAGASLSLVGFAVAVPLQILACLFQKALASIHQFIYFDKYLTIKQNEIHCDLLMERIKTDDWFANMAKEVEQTIQVLNHKKSELPDNSSNTEKSEQSIELEAEIDFQQRKLEALEATRLEHFQNLHLQQCRENIKEYGPLASKQKLLIYDLKKIDFDTELKSFEDTTDTDTDIAKQIATLKTKIKDIQKRANQHNIGAGLKEILTCEETLSNLNRTAEKSKTLKSEPSKIEQLNDDYDVYVKYCNNPEAQEADSEEQNNSTADSNKSQSHRLFQADLRRTPGDIFSNINQPAAIPATPDNNNKFSEIMVKEGLSALFQKELQKEGKKVTLAKLTDKIEKTLPQGKTVNNIEDLAASLIVHELYKQHTGDDHEQRIQAIKVDAQKAGSEVTAILDKLESEELMPDSILTDAISKSGLCTIIDDKIQSTITPIHKRVMKLWVLFDCVFGLPTFIIGMVRTIASMSFSSASKTELLHTILNGDRENLKHIAANALMNQAAAAKNDIGRRSEILLTFAATAEESGENLKNQLLKQLAHDTLEDEEKKKFDQQKKLLENLTETMLDTWNDKVHKGSVANMNTDIGVLKAVGNFKKPIEKKQKAAPTAATAKQEAAVASVAEAKQKEANNSGNEYSSADPPPRLGKIGAKTHTTGTDLMLAQGLRTPTLGVCKTPMLVAATDSRMRYSIPEAIAIDLLDEVMMEVYKGKETKIPNKLKSKEIGFKEKVKQYEKYICIYKPLVANKTHVVDIDTESGEPEDIPGLSGAAMEVLQDKVQTKLDGTKIEDRYKVVKAYKDIIESGNIEKYDEEYFKELMDEYITSTQEKEHVIINQNNPTK